MNGPQNRKDVLERNAYFEAREMKRLYYALSVPHNRSRLCFLLYLFIIPLFIVIGGITFSLSELGASQEASTRNSKVCIAERKILMKNLKALVKDELLTDFDVDQNFTRTWQLIYGTVMEIESCHRKKLNELAPVETFLFGNAMLYSFGIYTTIGYGNLFPHTITGRILTVAYAIIGIPLNMAFISDLGELMARAIRRSLQYFQKHVLKKTTEDVWIEYKKFSLVVLIAIIFTPTFAVIVMEVERTRHWSYIDSLYYSFTTSTLIGLGDLAPVSSYAQFFILMPIFFIAETIFALALGFITHLYRYESVIVYKLIKHKISSFVLERRLFKMRNALKTANSRSSRRFLTPSVTGTESEVSAAATSAAEAEIAKLSAQKRLINEKIDKEIQMLEAVPSNVKLGMLNARMESDQSEQQLRLKLKKWLRRKRTRRDASD